MGDSKGFGGCSGICSFRPSVVSMPTPESGPSESIILSSSGGTGKGDLDRGDAGGDNRKGKGSFMRLTERNGDNGLDGDACSSWACPAVKLRMDLFCGNVDGAREGNE